MGTVTKKVSAHNVSVAVRCAASHIQKTLILALASVACYTQSSDSSNNCKEDCDKLASVLLVKQVGGQGWLDYLIRGDIYKIHINTITTMSTQQ